MLRCPIKLLEPGMVLAAAVTHPDRPDQELVREGMVIDTRLIQALERSALRCVWIDHPAMLDFARLDLPELARVRHKAFCRLREDFATMVSRSLNPEEVQEYRHIVMELVCALLGGRGLCRLSDPMLAGPKGMYRHSTNVACLSLAIGMEMQAYVIQERATLAVERAKDLTSLGIGALLHDIGKMALSEDNQRRCVLTKPGDTVESDDGMYRRHTVLGYNMLRDTTVPASSKQVVLNHHQRWEGRGFPNKALTTNGKEYGTQDGQEIHIFSRICGAADVLDHLLERARRAGKPTAAALRAFASSSFDGWFDPTVRDAALRCLPPFGIGSTVVLSNGQSAAVVAVNQEQPCRPTLRRLTPEADGSYRTIDLGEERELCVVECDGIATEQYLFELEERPPLCQTLAKRSSERSHCGIALAG